MLRLYRALLSVTRGFAWAGISVLMGGMLITCIDIVARKSINFAVPGTVDITQLTVVAAAFTAIPYAFMTKGHVAVSLFIDHLGAAGRAVVSALAAALGLGLMAVLAWFAIDQTVQQAQLRDVSQTIAIPMLWYWAPVVAGLVLAAAVTLFLLLDAVVAMTTGRDPIMTSVE